MKYYFSGLLLCFCNLMSSGQQSKIDSLCSVLRSQKEDTNRVNTLNILADLYYRSDEYDSALISSDRARKLAKQLNFKEGIARAYNISGAAYNRSGKSPDALKHNKEALELWKELNSNPGMAVSFYNLGIANRNMGNYPEALKNYFASLRKSELINDKKGIGDAYLSIGHIYTDQSDPANALKNYSQAYNIYKELELKQRMSMACLGKGSAYSELKNDSSAIENFNTALAISEEIGDQYGVADSYNNIAIVLYNKADYQRALENYNAALKIFIELNDIGYVANTYINIGYNYSKQNNQSKAISYFQKGLRIADSLQDMDLQRNAWQGLSETYIAGRNYQKGYESYQKYILYKDSLVNGENTKKTLQMQMQYDFDKKQSADSIKNAELINQENLKHNLEIRQQKTYTFGGVLGFFLMIIVAGVSFRAYKNKQKANEIISQQKHLVEEKHREITDSINYAERIQRSFLATKSLLDEKLKDYFIFFQPKDVVSGDFYWADNLSDGKFALATADSTGHGVPGAIMSILNISSLEKAIEQNLSEPSEILNHTRKTIIERLKKDGSTDGGKDGMDCSLVCFDFTNRKLTFSGANNPVWIVREKQVLEFKPDKMPVGKHDKDQQPFSQHDFQWQKDDVIYTFTDGLPDQFGGPNGKKFMYKQFKEILTDICSLPMSEQKNILKNRFNSWKTDTEQIDDVLVIGVRL